MPERWLSVDEIAAHLGGNPDTIYKWITRKGRSTYMLRRVESLATRESIHFIKQASKTSETGKLPSGERVKQELTQQRLRLIPEKQRTHARACPIDKGSTYCGSATLSSALATLFRNSPNRAPARFMRCALAKCPMPSNQCSKGFKSSFRLYKE